MKTQPKSRDKNSYFKKQKTIWLNAMSYQIEFEEIEKLYNYLMKPVFLSIPEQFHRKVTRK